MSEKTTACPNCGGNQWITRERSDGTQITRCVMCNTERPKSETTRRPLDWYGPEDYDGYADPAEEIARVAAHQAEWDAAHMAFAAGGPTRLVLMWRGWISGFVAGAATVGFIWSIM